MIFDGTVGTVVQTSDGVRGMLSQASLQSWDSTWSTWDNDYAASGSASTGYQR
jgi:hypothetical protein